MVSRNEIKRTLVDVLLLLVLFPAVVLYALVDRDHVRRNASEAGYAARNMIENGRILVLYLFQQRYDNPSGSWWRLAASYQLTGGNDDWAGRLPSAMVISVLLTH
jgi:4-amino-4-deoxy-L-arabinose transferase-like glycosyltransferase